MNKNRSRIKNIRALAWLLILLIGLWVGQFMFETAFADWPMDETPWLAVAIIAVITMALILGHEEPEQTEDESDNDQIGAGWQRLRAIVRPFEKHTRTIALALALLLSSYTLFRIPNLILPNDSFRGVFVAWVTAFVLYVTAVSPVGQWQRRRNWEQWWPQHHKQIIAVTAICLLALILRGWRLDSIPFTLAGDEASQGLEAIKVLNGDINNPFATGWLGVPTMSFYFNSFTIGLMGNTVTALRLPWVFVGTITVLAVFFLVKRLKGAQMAYIVAILVATYHYHIHYSRLGSNQVADPFFLVLSLLFLYRALDGRNPLDWALTGGIAGVAFYFYAGARLTAVVILAILVYQFIRQPRQTWQKHHRGILIMLGAFLLVGGPIFQYAINFPGDFNARVNQVGILQSGWLVREVEIRQESMLVILFDQFKRAALAFNYYPDRTVWYGSREPLLDPFFGSLFLLGLLFGTAKLFGKTADDRTAPMVAWWWGGMLLGGMLTESPPSSQRLITLAVPACYFIGLALWELVQVARKSIRGVPTTLILSIAVLTFAIASVSTYFIEYTPNRYYGGGHAELATEIVPKLRELTPTHDVQFVGAPAMYWGFATLPYLIPDAIVTDQIDEIRFADVPSLLEPNRGTVFVVLPQREPELEKVRAAVAGELLEYYSAVDGRLMVSLYIVPVQDG